MKKSKKKGGCLKGFLTIVIVAIFVLVIIIISVVMGPVMQVQKFTTIFMSLFNGMEDNLYEWVQVNGDELQNGINEQLPYDVEALEAAMECEFAGEDICMFEITGAEGTVYVTQYDLNTLVSNYSVPWQLLLSVCTVNQIEDGVHVENVEQMLNSGYRYSITSEHIYKVNDEIGTNITYVTDYAKYRQEDNIFKIPSYEELSENCITDFNMDNSERFACVYMEAPNGEAVYYPVICLDSVTTWLYEYKFHYEIKKDEEGRPIEYRLAGVTKQSRVEEFLLSLETLGIDESELSLLKLTVDAMPFSSDRGISISMMKEYNYYMVNGGESVYTDYNYSEGIVLKEPGALNISAEGMDEIRKTYSIPDDNWSDGIKDIYENKRSSVLAYASKFLYSVYYLPPKVDKENNKISYVSGWYSKDTSFSSEYPEFGQPIDDLANDLGDYYREGLLYGMTDWDFVTMILADTIYFDVSSEYIDTVGVYWKEEHPLYYSSATLLRPKYDEEWTGKKGYEYVYFTTSDAFYQFCVTLNKSALKAGREPYEILNPTNDWLSGNRDGLKMGDIAMYVENGTAYSAGIYVGKINGHDSFVHLGGGSSDLGKIQPCVCISYHEDEGVIHPDGGTVNYNVYIRVKKGSYPSFSVGGKYNGNFIGWRE